MAASQGRMRRTQTVINMLWYIKVEALLPKLNITQCYDPYIASQKWEILQHRPLVSFCVNLANGLCSISDLGMITCWQINGALLYDMKSNCKILLLSCGRPWRQKHSSATGHLFTVQANAILLSADAAFCLCSLFSLPAQSFSLQGRHVNNTTNWWWVPGAVADCVGCVGVWPPCVSLLYTSVIFKVRQSVKKYVCFTVLACLLCTSVCFHLIITVCACMGNHDCVARGYHHCYLLFFVCIYTHSMCLCTSSWVKRVILNLGLFFFAVLNNFLIFSFFLLLKIF